MTSIDENKPESENTETGTQSEPEQSDHAEVELRDPPLEDSGFSASEKLLFAGVGLIVVAIICFAIAFSGGSDIKGDGKIGGGNLNAPGGQGGKTSQGPVLLEGQDYKSDTLSFRMPKGSSDMTRASNKETEEVRFKYKGDSVRVRTQSNSDADTLKSLAGDWRGYGKVRKTKAGGRTVLYVTVDNSQLVSVLGAFISRGRVNYVQVVAKSGQAESAIHAMRQIISTVKPSRG